MPYKAVTAIPGLVPFGAEGYVEHLEDSLNVLEEDGWTLVHIQQGKYPVFIFHQDG